MSISSDSITPITPEKNEERIDRKCSACEMGKDEEEKNLMISLKPATTTSRLEASDDGITDEISNIHQSSGSSLDLSSRGFMESRFGGHDLSNARMIDPA
jgi:hypothetical protein